MEDAKSVAADISAGPRGILRVTTSVSFGQTCIVPPLGDFAAAHPELTIDLLLTDAVIDIVTERIDVAVRLGRLVDSSLVATRREESLRYRPKVRWA